MALRVLVVDDSSVMRKIVCRMLTQAGFTPTGVVEASDGAEALDKFKPAEIDLILSDWHMPNMDGLEFVRRIRALEDGTGKRVPIVMVTTEGAQAKMEEAKQLGVDGYVTKPFTPDSIKEKLTPILAGK